MRSIADQHPVIFETLVSAILFLVSILVVLQVVIPRLEGGGRLATGAVLRISAVATVVMAVLTFVLLRLVYST